MRPITLARSTVRIIAPSARRHFHHRTTPGHFSTSEFLATTQSAVCPSSLTNRAMGSPPFKAMIFEGFREILNHPVRRHLFSMLQATGALEESSIYEKSDSPHDLGVYNYDYQTIGISPQFSVPTYKAEILVRVVDQKSEPSEEKAQSETHKAISQAFIISHEYIHFFQHQLFQNMPLLSAFKPEFISLDEEMAIKGMKFEACTDAEKRALQKCLRNPTDDLEQVLSLVNQFCENALWEDDGIIRISYCAHRDSGRDPSLDDWNTNVLDDDTPRLNHW